VLLASCAAARDTGALSADALMTHVRVLAALHGRLAGSADEAAAATYVETQLRSFSLAPQSQPIPDTASRNVYAMIEGGPEVIVIGAHLDHLGDGYPGADDDASGVAAVLGVAQTLAARHDLARSVLVVFFGAEEAGMVGSRAFVADPPVPLARIVAMVNVDMIGRPVLDQRWARVPLALFGISREHAVGLVGTSRYPGLRAIADHALDQTVAPEDLPDTIEREVAAAARGRGDSVSFEERGIPALFFGDAESRDYHQPTDTIDRLHPRLLARSARGIASTVIGLTSASRAAFASSDATPPKRFPRAGWYLPIGVVGALGDGARAGGEVSLVHLWSGSIAYAGAYADAMWGAGERRVTFGPELGWRFLGVDGGYVLGGGAVARVFATVSLLSVGVRAGWLRGAGDFAEAVLLIKVPLRVP